MNPIALLLALLPAFFSNSANACFLGIGCDNTPQASSPVPLLNACVGRLTNVYPADEATQPQERGNLRKLTPSCPDGFKADPQLQLYLLPRIENGQHYLYVMDEKDQKLRVRRFPATFGVGSQQIELQSRDYRVSCRLNSNSGGGPDIVQSPLVLNVNFSNRGGKNLFRISQQKTDFALNRQVQTGHDDLGPHITEMVLEEVAKDAPTFSSLPRRPGFSDQTVNELKKYCRELAEQSAQFPKGNSSDGSQERIATRRDRVLEFVRAQGPGPTAPSHTGPASKTN